jgi:hypothetical protein
VELEQASVWGQRWSTQTAGAVSLIHSVRESCLEHEQQLICLSSTKWRGLRDQAWCMPFAKQHIMTFLTHLCEGRAQAGASGTFTI